VVSAGPSPHLKLQVANPAEAEPSVGNRAQAARKGERLAYFPETNGFTPTPIYDRYRLRPGAEFMGPAIIEERESTVIVGPGSRCHLDDHDNLVVDLPAATI
jgi:N-methylhydantoinase A